jgi:methyl-accepting chemotaxis protein
MNDTTQTLLVIFVAVAAISILMQAGFTVAMFFGARAAQKKLTALAEDVRLHAMPVLMSSRELVTDVSPKVRTIIDDLTVTTATVRSKADQIGGVVTDVTNRAQAQASRVDDMVKGTLDGLNSAVHAIEHGVAKPVRHVNGFLNGIRAGVEVLRTRTPEDVKEAREPEADLFV